MKRLQPEIPSRGELFAPKSAFCDYLGTFGALNHRIRHTHPLWPHPRAHQTQSVVQTLLCAGPPNGCVQKPQFPTAPLICRPIDLHLSGGVCEIRPGSRKSPHRLRQLCSNLMGHFIGVALSYLSHLHFSVTTYHVNRAVRTGKYARKWNVLLFPVRNILPYKRQYSSLKICQIFITKFCDATPPVRYR